MATMKLTPKQNANIVGWELPAPTLLGWQMSNANPMDVMIGSQTIGFAAGYHVNLSGGPDQWPYPSRYDWSAKFTKPNHPPLVLAGGQWLVTDGDNAAVRTDEYVRANYDFEPAPAPAPWTPPTPSAEPNPEEIPA